MANMLRFVTSQLLFSPNDSGSLAFTDRDCKCCRCCGDCQFNCETTIDNYYEIVWINDSFYGPVPYTRYTGSGVIGNKTTGPHLDGNCDFCVELEEWSYSGPLPWTSGDELLEVNWSLTGSLPNDYWIGYDECGWRTEVGDGYGCQYDPGTCSGDVTIFCGTPYTTGVGVTGGFTVTNPSCDGVV